jgi:hypothetical protein
MVYGRMVMTDGLEVVLETKREACALINDIYDLRLAVRTGIHSQMSVLC